MITFELPSEGPSHATVPIGLTLDPSRDQILNRRPVKGRPAAAETQWGNLDHQATGLLQPQQSEAEDSLNRVVTRRGSTQRLRRMGVA